MIDIQTIVATGKSTTEEASAAFDDLEAVDIEFMLGRWKGRELHTGHIMDGLLEATGWYGKEFIGAEHVHPLLFRSGKRINRLGPRRLFSGMIFASTVSKVPALLKLFTLVSPLLKTRRSRARLRMTEYRGKVSATMVYDNLPINDVFRKIDDNTVMGVMDMKGVSRPYFFLLLRDTTA